MLLVSLLLLATATALPVPDTNQPTPRSGTEALGDAKLVPLPPGLPPPQSPPCPCDSCQGGVIPPYEVVGEFTDAFGNPLLIVNPNGSGEDEWFSGEDSDYFSEEFSPEEISMFCAENPKTPECQEFLSLQPPKVVNINIVAPPGGALKPSIPPPGFVNPLVSSGSWAIPVPQKPIDVDPLDQLASVDPPTKDPVVQPPTPNVDPNLLSSVDPVDPVTLNPLEPLPLASADQITLNPLDANTEIPVDVVEESQPTVNQANFSGGSLVFPSDQSVLSPSDPLSAPTDTLSGASDAQLDTAPKIDTRIT